MKQTTSAYYAIDIRRLHREGLLEPYHLFELKWLQNGSAVASVNIQMEPGAAVLHYCLGDRGLLTKRYPVHLDWTMCFFGGRRPWFLCPGQHCGRRVAVLYGGDDFLCRHCQGLVYESQRENQTYRAIRRAESIREVLNWLPGIGNPSGSKPKGMHWKTYKTLTERHNSLADAGFAGILTSLSELKKK